MTVEELITQLQGSAKLGELGIEAAKTLRVLNTRQNHDAEKLTSDIITVKNDLADAQRDAAAQIATLHEEIDTLSGALNESKAHAKTLEIQLDLREKQVEGCDEKLKAAQKENEELKAEITRLQLGL